MLRQILFTLFTVLLIASAGEAQVNRTIDGTGNNLQNDSWGSEGATLQTLTTVGFRDGYSLPGGLDRPSPRWISNKIFAQDTLIPDPMGLSDYTWAFGQFIDHEIIAVASNRAENVSIPVNFPDPHMNPGGLFTTFIPMSRSQIVAGSGTDANNPRQYANEITSWMDGSAVYGSDDECAAWLRSFVDGKLKVSRGDLLPFNTLTGELEGDIDPSAPHMENENPFITKLFVAGDARANENPILASLHLLFVREHNRLCDELVRQHPDWTDEELYQRVRKFVGGYIQAIVFEEWLPTMGLQLPPYEGYNPDLNPNISNVFSVATFRLGHTLLNSKIVRRDNDGNKIPQGDICLKDAFFNPFVIQQVGGVDPYLKGMAVQVQQAMDIKVIDDVRNFLFGPPGSGMAGLDLAAININRGRERGLADFNTIRQDFGLTPYTSFSQISSDSATIALLQSLYSDVNQIDPWVGMLAEQPQSSNILFGETIARIMELQFMALREGDRYYYENDPALSEDDRYDIRNTTMHDVVKRNTNIDILQENVFIATPYDSICPAPLARLPMLGQIMTEDGRMLKDVDVRLDGEQPSINRAMTDSMGQFTFEGAVACGSYQLRPVKNDGISNGVSTYDLVLLSKHILGIELLDSPFKIIAADVNKSGDVTAIDMVDIRKLVLGLTSEFPNNTSWRFIDQSFVFDTPATPLDEAFPESIAIPSLLDTSSVSFTAIKVGDVSNNARVSGVMGSESRGRKDRLALQLDNRQLEAGKKTMITFHANQMNQIAGYQFAINYDESQLEVVQILPEEGITSAQNFAHFTEEGVITTSWNGDIAEEEDTPLFSLLVRPVGDVSVQDVIELLQTPDFTQAEAYDKSLSILDVALQFSTTEPELMEDFYLYQNRPNPFRSTTQLPFELPSAATAVLTLYDMAGKEIYRIEKEFEAGYQTLELNAKQLPAAGVLYYRLDTPWGSATRRMVVLE